MYSISYVVLCYNIYSRFSRTTKWVITWMSFCKQRYTNFSNFTCVVLCSYEDGSSRTAVKFSLLWTLECCLRAEESLKDFSHDEQLNGFSPVWILECVFRSLDCAKDFGQRVQVNGFSPVWTLKCTLRWLGCAKDFGQRVQVNGFSPVW
jgi:hypothetical protein